MRKITPEWIQKKLLAIRAVAGDDETAHGLEDRLHVDVLGAIVRGACDDPVRCAELALSSKEINFHRWCA